MVLYTYKYTIHIILYVLHIHKTLLYVLSQDATPADLLRYATALNTRLFAWTMRAALPS